MNIRIKRNPEKLHMLNEDCNDWDGISDEELTFWQKVAKRTKGILTLANGITLASSVLVINGLCDFMNGHKLAGIIKVGTGRIGDLIDGSVADATTTKGRVGRALDPLADWVQLAFALPILESQGVLPLAATVAVGAPKAIEGIACGVGTLRHQNMAPTEEGKTGIFAVWTGIGAFALKAATHKYAPGVVETGLETLGWAGMVGGSIYRLSATKEYINVGFGPSQHAGVSPDSDSLAA